MPAHIEFSLQSGLGAIPDTFARAHGCAKCQLRMLINPEINLGAQFESS